LINPESWLSPKDLSKKKLLLKSYRLCMMFVHDILENIEKKIVVIEID
jgi:hypothetical protein